MKRRLPLWERAPSSTLRAPAAGIYPDRPLAAPLPIVCIGTTRGPTVAEPAAHSFFEALSLSDRSAFVKLASSTEASRPPQLQANGQTWHLKASVEKLPEALVLLLRDQPQLQLVVVNVFAWHLLYETALSVLVGPLSEQRLPPMPQPLERVALWMPEARATVLTDLAHNVSSIVVPAC